MKFNKIYSSNENLEVGYLPFNRPRTRKHVNELAVSMRKHGWLGTVIMIYTNLYSKKWKLWILDGQHRVDAANLVKVQYRYEIREVTNHEEVITLMADLNNNSKGWFLRDYILPWRSVGHKPYAVLQETLNRTNLPLAGLIRLYSAKTFGSDNGGSTTSKFKRGAFELKNKSLAEEIIEEALALKPVLVKISDPFLMAFADLYVTNRKSYKRSVLIRALQRNKDSVKLLTKVIDIRATLQKLYKAS